VDLDLVLVLHALEVEIVDRSIAARRAERQRERPRGAGAKRLHTGLPVLVTMRSGKTSVSRSRVACQSKRGSSSETSRNQRSTLARAKPSIPRPGRQSLGRPDSANTAKNVASPVKSTPVSNVIGMKAGAEWGGRPPTSIG